MMGLGYPGGPVIEKIAGGQDPDRIHFPRSFLEKGSYDFSFSGLKSAVARHLHENPNLDDLGKAQVAASFQAAVIDVLTAKLIRSARDKHCTGIGVAGGVSANQTFIQSLTKEAGRHGITVFSPPLSLCGDNAAMIAARGFTMIQKGDLSGPDQDVYSRVRTLPAKN